MASPQRENGFTGVANEVLEAVMMRGFSSLQLRILLLLWRESYGWQRRSAKLSLGLIERTTGIPRARASKLLHGLLDLKVLELVVPATRVSSAVYAFQKDYDRWGVPPQGVPPQGVTPQGDRECPPGGQGECPPGGHIKERVKENQQHGGVPSHGDTLVEDVLRMLVQLQPSGLSQADRTAVAALLRNTDKSPRRVLEAVADAVSETQAHRKTQSTRAPVRFALAIAGRLLSEPEPCSPEFVVAPPGWEPPGSRVNGSRIDSGQSSHPEQASKARNDSRGHSVEMEGMP